jgi:hypothetical protein
MGYQQWVVVVLRNRSKTPVIIRNIDVKYGRFYKDGTPVQLDCCPLSCCPDSLNVGNKDAVVNLGEIEGKEIAPGKQFKFNSCGKSDSPTGTEAEFDLIDKDTGEVIRHVYWDCPYTSSRNTFTVSGDNEDWIVEDKGANLDGGALGHVTITVNKL